MTVITTLPGLPATTELAFIPTGHGGGFGAFFLPAQDVPLRSSGVYAVTAVAGTVIVSRLITDEEHGRYVTDTLQALAQPLADQLGTPSDDSTWITDATQLNRRNKFELRTSLPTAERTDVTLNFGPGGLTTIITLPGGTYRQHTSQTGQVSYSNDWHDDRFVSEQHRVNLHTANAAWQALLDAPGSDARRIVTATGALRTRVQRHARQVKLEQNVTALDRIRTELDLDAIAYRVADQPAFT